MLRANDNWERLVGAVLKRQQIWELCHAHSRSPSVLSDASSSDFSSSSIRQTDTLSAYGQGEDAIEGSGNRVQQQSSMDDAAFQFLLENLQQFATYHSKLINEAIANANEVLQLHNDLRLFKQFLNDTTKKRREDSLGELDRQIRDVVNEAEDVIDSFVIQAAEPKSKNYFRRFFKAPSNRHDAVRAARVRSQIEKIYCGSSRLEDAIDGDNNGG